MSRRLFVGNVSPAVTGEDLEELFSGAGEVVSVRIPLDRESGRPRGFAFVEFATREQAQRARENLDDAVLEGQRIRLRVAHDDPKPGRGGPPRRRFASRESAADDDDEKEDRREWRESERGGLPAGRRGRRRRHGKHGSDRVRGRGTRRFIE